MLGADRIAARNERERLVGEHQTRGHEWTQKCRSCAGEIAFGISGLIYPDPVTVAMRSNPFNWRVKLRSQEPIERKLAQSIEEIVDGPTR